MIFMKERDIRDLRIINGMNWKGAGERGNKMPESEDINLITPGHKPVIAQRHRNTDYKPHLFNDHFNSLKESLSGLIEGADMMRYLIDQYQDHEQKMQAIERWDADIKIHMQQIRYTKKLLKKCKTKK
jgi:hypothetical protein